jgi:hypothetical protein
VSSYDTSDHDLSTYAQIIARIGKYAPVFPLFGENPCGTDISSLLAWARMPINTGNSMFALSLQDGFHQRHTF